MTWSVGRVSTLQYNLSNQRHVERTSVAYQQASQEVSTGKRANIFSDLGSRATVALKLRNDEAETQTHIHTNEFLMTKLDAMLVSIDTVRDQVQGVLQSAITNMTTKGTGLEQLQQQAASALDTVIAVLNTNYNGDHLFSGTSSDRLPLMRWEEASAATGLSPQDVMAALIGAGPADAADAAVIADNIDAVFASAYGANPDYDFESTFYAGTKALKPDLTPSERVTARIGPARDLDYGVQANDQGMRDVLQGLAMLASIDAGQIADPGAYTEWMTRATTALNAGQQGALNLSATVGFHQQVVENELTRLTDLSLVQRSQVSSYEDVDTYEAVTRLTNLETQLQASYQIAARMQGLSILNFL